MKTLITKANFQRALDNWAYPEFHALYLAPFFAVQEAQRVKDIALGKKPPLWLWDNKRTVNKCLEIIWHLTGEWQARRSISIKKPKTFRKVVVDCVMDLASTFNKYEINALWDIQCLKQSNQKRYESIISLIEENIEQISRTRLTEKVQPVLGSKVIHHFFPSIVPVYDDALISKRVLKLDSFKEFKNNNKGGWIFKNYGKENRMQEYHYYITFCTQQICKTNKSVLDELREKMANLYKDLSPYSLVICQKSLLWKLDAKIAEYCLIGETYR